MALRTIRVQGDPVLEKICKPVKELTPRTKELIEDMLDTMYEANGVGLAAPQVGILKRIVVIDVGEGPVVMVNPVILETSGEQTGDEGCLSIPGKAGQVTRPNYVKVHAFDENMEEYEIEGTELMARAMCHEIMRVIFMGTPDFAVGTLEEIIKAGHEVVLVVSQPDKAVGRSKALKYTPVKECAVAHGIEVYQPAKIRAEESVEYLRQYNADIIIVEAFGQIIPKAILDMPRFGCVNVHASLLPKYRGAAPIQWAVLNGDQVTGVTTMRMDEGLDTGDMIMKQEVIVDEDETGGSLFDKLSEVGAKLCVKTMEAIENGTAVYTPQDDALATHTGKIQKEMGSIDWSKDAEVIERLVRGLNPWPSAYTRIDDKNLKIWRAKVISHEVKAAPGCILKVTKDELEVQTGNGVLALLEVQLEGKKRMTTDAFLRGYQVTEGSFLKRC